MVGAFCTAACIAMGATTRSTSIGWESKGTSGTSDTANSMLWTVGGGINALLTDCEIGGPDDNNCTPGEVGNGDSGSKLLLLCDKLVGVAGGGELDKLLNVSSNFNLSNFGNSIKLAIGDWAGLEILMDSNVCDTAGFINSWVTAAALEPGFDGAGLFGREGTSGVEFDSGSSEYIPKIVSLEGAFSVLVYISKIVSRLESDTELDESECSLVGGDGTVEFFGNGTGGFSRTGKG
jgi:hypothetical protein